MPRTSAGQPLTYSLRLPNEAQADALRLLETTRTVVNRAIQDLWPCLDDFAHDRAIPAWKRVGALYGSPDPHGNRQWRCESELVGPMLRTQATRKQLFLLVLPILTDGFIRHTTPQRPAGKDRVAIKDAVAALHQALDDDNTSVVALQSLIEQACNFYLQHERFPRTYDELQPVPLLSCVRSGMPMDTA